MKRFMSGMLFVLGMLLIFAPLPVAAQEVTAQVRTWTGQTWRLAEPWIEVFYTIMPRPKEGEGAPPGPGAMPMAGLPGGGETRPEVRGSFQSLRQLFDVGPEPQRAQRDLQVLTLSSAGVEVRVPVGQIVSLTIVRQLIAGSPLPPYVVLTHYRYSAVAQLADGSRVEADSVNFGTAVVRGMTTAGRVEIPFEEIESVRFDR
ncbi:MAG: hypothetical protein ACRELA_16125 [Candidatus Rokuibacteriota bacterium]